jgi:hypothetical protein
LAVLLEETTNPELFENIFQISDETHRRIGMIFPLVHFASCKDPIKLISLLTYIVSNDVPSTFDIRVIPPWLGRQNLVCERAHRMKV